MVGKHQDGKGGMACSEFDSRLIDALDGVLSGLELEQFRTHAEACLDCGPIYQQASQGMQMLKSLADVEPPQNLVHNILARTTMRESQAVTPTGEKPGWARRFSDFIAPGFAPTVAPAFSGMMRGMMTPRFAMTAAMTFFSITMVLNVAGVNLADLKRMDLRPSAISTNASLQYHEATSKVIKYYENIRFVYEWESRLKAIKNASDENGQKQKEEQKKRPDDSSEREKQRQEKDVNYSLTQSASSLAVTFINTPISVPETEGR